MRPAFFLTVLFMGLGVPIFGATVSDSASLSSSAFSVCLVKLLPQDSLAKLKGSFRGNPIIKLADPPFRNDDHRNALAALFQPFLTDDGPINPTAYEEQARRFAENRDLDTMVSFYNTDLAQGKTRVKFNLRTGDLLVVSPEGHVAVFTRLPAGERPFGWFRNTAEVANALARPIRLGDSQTQTIPTIAVAEDLAPKEFSVGNAYRHFNKHVLAMGNDTTLDKRINELLSNKTDSDTSEFPELLGPFLRESESAASSERFNVHDRHIELYRQQAFALAQSRMPWALSLSRLTANGYRQTLKINLLHNRLVIVNRNNGSIVTYFGWRKRGLDVANRQLKNQFNLPPVRSFFEYSLIMGTLPLHLEKP